jgi:hypothetical protein
VSADFALRDGKHVCAKPKADEKVAGTIRFGYGNHVWVYEEVN